MPAAVPQSVRRPIVPDEVESLARRAMGGEREAWEPLLEGTLPLIRFIIRDLLPDRRQNHEDVAQDLALDILSLIGTVRESYPRFVYWRVFKRVHLEMDAASDERRTVSLESSDHPIDVEDPNQ